MNFRKYLSPCTHAIAACLHETEDPFDYMDWKYSVDAYKKTYKHFLVPLSIEDLPSEPGILPPVAKKQRGRPKTKRIRKGAYTRKEQHCRNCNAVDHNAQRCPSTPAINGRQQRARGRDLSISNSSSESSSSSDSEDSEKSNESDDSEQQFRREMDQYDEMVARAHRIAGTDRQRCRELDSNGMEGIETGSSNVTRQGDQQIDAMEIGGNSEMHGLVFSPRKTRSGRILQRIE
jgi:hypothetical protein